MLVSAPDYTRAAVTGPVRAALARVMRVAPPRIRRAARGAARRAVVLRARFSRPTSTLPPDGAVLVGGGGAAVGEEFLGHFRRLGGLEPHHAVLDVGCGFGRMAAPLTRYLDGGSYEGFDVAADAIEWCRLRIGPLHRNFRFIHVDVANARYNPGGAIPAAQFSFPYASESFDFAFATSVLTHMLADGAATYLSEIARVLKPGAACVVTFFLLDAEARHGIGRGDAELDFRYEAAGCLTVDRREPETAVAHPEASVRELYARLGLAIQEPIRFGRWSGRSDGLSYQDIVVARKRGSS